MLGLLKRQGEQWKVWLMAPTDSVIDKEDRVIMIARFYAETDPNPKLPPLPVVQRGSPRIVTAAPVQKLQRILVLGWNRRVPSLLAELSSYHYRPFQVDVISVVGAAERDQLTRRHLGKKVDMEVQHIEADYMVEAELRQLQPAAYDTVMLLSSDRLASGEEADARTMVGYLQLEDVLADQSRRPQLIMELSDPDNSHLLYNHSSEMLISPMILSHVLAQVALRRELRVVLDELFTVGGAEVQFRDPGDYTLPASVDFQLLERTLAKEGEIALGIYRNQPDAKGRHLMLNPPRRDYLDIKSGDRFVILCLTGQVSD